MSSPTPIRDYLESGYKQSQRNVLNTQPHFLPIDIKTLQLTLSRVINLSVEDLPIDLRDMTGRVTSIAEFRNKVTGYAKTNYRGKIIIRGNETVAKNAGKTELNPPTDILISKFTPAVVYENGEGDDNIVGLLFSSFDSAKKNLFTDFLNKELNIFLQEIVNILVLSENEELEISGSRERKKSERTFNVGHIFGSSLAVTPLQIKIEKLLSALGPLSVDGGSVTLNVDGKSTIVQLPQGKNLAGVKAAVDTVYSSLKKHSTYGTTIETSLSKNLNGFLTSVSANIVIIQDSYENQRIYADLLETPAWSTIKKLLATVNFSRNLVEEYGYAYVSALTGKKIAKSIAVKKLAPIKITKKVKYTTVTEKSKANIKLKATSPNNAVNLIQLQNLINQSLVQRVKANMGRGERGDILNLRTGRFAESVKVERMSQGRQGMITAYYSYMKNPYATFSQGGEQSSPSFRDPKLLIAKSIREIAAKQVADRLRSVVV